MYTAVLDGAWRQDPPHAGSQCCYTSPGCCSYTYCLWTVGAAADMCPALWGLYREFQPVLFFDRYRNSQLERIDFSLLLKAIFSCPFWGQAAYSAPEAECFLSQNYQDYSVIPTGVRSRLDFRTKGRGAIAQALTVQMCCHHG